MAVTCSVPDYRKPIFVVSDSTGESAERAVNKALTQYALANRHLTLANNGIAGD